MPAVFVFVVALAVLVISGRLLIRYLTRAAAAFNVSEFTLAFVLLALGTSLPELFVGLISARQGAGDLVLAMALGSNVINATLIIGLAAFLSVGISTATLNLRRDVILSAAIVMLPLLFLLTGGVISTVEAAILIGVFLYYIFLLYRDSKRQTEPLNLPHVMHGVVASLAVVALLAVLLAAAHFTVDAATRIAVSWHIPAVVIGLLLLAGGTSLPELATTIQVALKHKPGLALGTIIGSNVANSALVIGAAGLVRPLEVTVSGPLITAAVFVIVATSLLAYFASSRRQLSAREGLVLMALFLLYAGITIVTGLPAS
jgi:cation:H+ antiporter